MSLSKYIPFLKDVFLNLFASGTVIIILQIIIYPYFSRNYSSSDFGDILITIAIVNTIAIMLGSSLNNLRLKNYNRDNLNNYNGDYSLFYLYFCIVNLFLMVIIQIFISSNFLEIISLSILSILMMSRVYFQAELRINLLYNKIFFLNLLYGIGLVIGMVFSNYVGLWYLTFISGEIISLLYLFKTTHIWKEKYSRTIIFKNNLKNLSYLTFSNGLKNGINYLDRFILFPVLGSHFLGVFFTATVLGKMSSFILTPLSGVLLSYLAKQENKLTLSNYFKIHLITVVFGMIMFVITIIGTHFTLPYLYPDFYQEAFEIIFVANAGAIIKTLSYIPQMIVLNYSSTFKQIKIQLVDLITYLIFGIILLYYGGLSGFCIGILISSVVKYIYISIIGYKSLK